MIPRSMAKAAAGAAAILFLAGCSAESRQKWLPVFFDGVLGSDQPPPTRRFRRDLQREIEELKRELAAAREAKQSGDTDGPRGPAVGAKTWEQAAALLPRDPAGEVDWDAAVTAGAIAPRPSREPGAPAQAVLDLDVELGASASKLFGVTYRHAPHTRWLACGNCHPAPFPLGRQAKPAKITMASLAAGQYCGGCHGPVAFGLDRHCARCHAKIPATSAWRRTAPPIKPIEAAANWDQVRALVPKTDDAPDWSKALADGAIAPRPGIDPKASEADTLDTEVERGPKGDDSARVVFRHATHTAWLACESCHPEPFQMEAGATPMSMDILNEGKLCGACHGTVAFSMDACGRCHPAMGGGG